MHKKKSRPGLMPLWQRLFSWISLLICSFSGMSYTLGHQFSLSRLTLGNHLVLAIHGISAMAAIIALGSILPVHLKVGLNSKKSLISGLSQLGLMLFLVITSGLLYYGPEDIRDPVVLFHWVSGLIFISFFLFHGFKRIYLPKL
jgi:hypothetical protein